MKLIEHLQSRTKDNTCPVCGGKSWIYLGKFESRALNVAGVERPYESLEVHAQQTNTPQGAPGYYVLPIYKIACKNCHHIRDFAAKPIDA